MFKWDFDGMQGDLSGILMGFKWNLSGIYTNGIRVGI